MKQYISALLTTTKADDGKAAVYTFQASTDAVDRQDEVVTADGWELDNYKANPVVLDSHNYDGIENIIGRSVDVRATKTGLEADITFNGSAKGKLAEQLVQAGDLRAVSVGFVSKEVRVDPKGEQPVQHIRKELLEISMVPVPANAGALRLRGMRMAHPPHAGPMAPEDAAWDAGAEVRKAEGEEQLWRMHAWRDSEGDPEAKASYKLPHHMATGEVVWRGVAAAMAALLGGRGGVQIPDGDRRAVYNHLERHYRQFEKEPPEFKSLDDLAAFGPEEIKGLFWEGEMDGVSEKAGRRNSKADLERMQRVMDSLSSAMDEMRALMSDMVDEQQPKVIEIDLSKLEALVAGKEK